MRAYYPQSEHAFVIRFLAGKSKTIAPLIWDSARRMPTVYVAIQQSAGIGLAPTCLARPSGERRGGEMREVRLGAAG